MARRVSSLLCKMGWVLELLNDRRKKYLSESTVECARAFDESCDAFCWNAFALLDSIVNGFL